MIVWCVGGGNDMVMTWSWPGTTGHQTPATCCYCGHHWTSICIIVSFVKLMSGTITGATGSTGACQHQFLLCPSFLPLVSRPHPPGAGTWQSLLQHSLHNPHDTMIYYNSPLHSMTPCHDNNKTIQLAGNTQHMLVINDQWWTYVLDLLHIIIIILFDTKQITASNIEVRSLKCSVNNVKVF